MILTPDRYGSVPIYDLLLEAEKGRVAFDHRLLDALDARREETLAALERFTAVYREDRLVDLDEQVFDLYRHYRAPAAARFYNSMLRRNTGDVPDALVEAYVELGAASVEPLLELYAELGPEEGADVLFVLAALGVRDERIFERLIETLGRDPYEGALCLGLYRDRAAIPHLEAARAAAGPEEAKAIGDAIEQLQTDPGPAVDWTFEIRPLYPERTTPLFGALPESETLEFLECAEAEYRTEAALSFGDEAYSDAVRDRLVHHAQHDSDAGVRAACLRALGERDGEPAVHELLLAVLGDPGRTVEERCAALVGTRAHDAILAFYEDPAMRAAALEAMWRTLDLRYAEYFPRHAEDDNHEIRRRAIQGIGAFNLTKHAHLLVPSLSDDVLREEALFAYALALPGKTTRKSVHSMLDTIDEHAGGLSSSEVEVVEFALDRRLERDGLDPVFHVDDAGDLDEEEAGEAIAPAQSQKVGRNDPCPCGSGKKYKKCCGA
jgi:HEAT repeat protein